MTRRPRVLLVGPLPPPFGGMPRYVQDILEGDLSSRVCLAHFDTALGSDRGRAASNRGHRRWLPGRQTGWAKYAYLFSDGAGGAARHLAGVAGSLARFLGRVRRERPDVVHVVSNMHWGYWRNSVYVLTGRLLGARAVFHPLGAIDQFHANSGPLGRRAISWVLDRCDVIVVQSTGLAETVAGMTRTPVVGLFNGIDLEPFEPLSGARAERRESVTFLAVGDLGHNKGTYDILEAAPAVLGSCPDARWLFIGRGDLEEFQRLAAGNGLEGRCEFLGAVDEAAKMEAYARADVFLLPSYGEGQPLSILEAMAAGLPIISSTVGSIPEVVGEENGCLVAPGDVPGLAAAMSRLAGSRGLRDRMAARNRADARARFDVRRLHRELQGLYEDLA